ncbi:MAG: 4a-hydroxytetrahydrobiopterin dehydratase [Candidatus Elarobacter sp.]
MPRARSERTHVGSLAERRCIPCRGDVPPLTRAQLVPLVAQIDPAWNVRDVPDERRGSVMTLWREYGFPGFKDAMGFAVRVGEMAEEQQHHPDLHVAWGKVGVEIWTHKIGGLTESDVVFAAKCDALYVTASSSGA